MKSFANVKWIHTVPSASLLPQGSSLVFRFGKVWSLGSIRTSCKPVWCPDKEVLKRRGAVLHIKQITFEPRLDKTNKVSVCPAMTQISLGIRPVWSESSLSAWRKLGSLATHWAHSEDSDQTGRILRVKGTSRVWCLEDGSKMQDCGLPFHLFLCFY